MKKIMILGVLFFMSGCSWIAAHPDVEDDILQTERDIIDASKPNLLNKVLPGKK